MNRVGVEINIYDAIEKVYELNSVELAGVLDVSMGVLGYASTQRTIPKRKRQFSSRLHIPESFFDEFLSTQLDALKKCREEFRDCYGDELIEKFKQNGYAAMEAKIEKQNAVDKIKMKSIGKKTRTDISIRRRQKCTMIYLMITNPGTM